jgi:terminase large subunit-like protein
MRDTDRPLVFPARVLAPELPSEQRPPPLQLEFRQAWRSPVITWADCDKGRRALLEAAWSVGELGHLLTPSQQACDAKMTAWSRSSSRRGRVYVLDSSRRWGKSALLLKRALEKAIQNKGHRLVYFAPEYKMVNRIILPLMGLLTQDCPPGLHGKKQGPDWVKTDGTFYFKNGSRIELVGLDVNPDGARGTGIDGGYGDEVAFFDKLEYLLTSVVMPQMLGRPHARLECASTPPVSPAHYWTQEMVPAAVADGAHDTRTIEQADQYDTAEIIEFVANAGGKDSIACQREYYCRHVTDESLAIIPEFQKIEGQCVRALEVTPKWRNCFVSMDPGWHDATGVLFGYWDFDNSWLVIEDEICAPQMTSEVIGLEIMRIEEKLWRGVPLKRNGKVEKQPYYRVTDVDRRLTEDLQTMHGLAFTKVKKDSLEQQVNAVRVAFSRGQIVIHPRCKKLIHQLRNGVFQASRTRLRFDWKRDELGHFDCVAALLYLWRTAHDHRHKSPYPVEAYYVNGKDHNPKLGDKPPGFSRWTIRGRHFRIGTAGR